LRLGIDPGITGAIALLDKDLRYVDIKDMPAIAGIGKRQQVNAAEVSRIVRVWKQLAGDEPIIAFVEQVAAMPGQGVSSMFSFGDSFGVIRGVLAASDIPLLLVHPRQWKQRAGLIGTEKDKARTVAQNLYPAVPLARKKDIGRADALLIARYGENK
jgi:crossover junction endodeoxyribonuclease RuvC